MSARARPCELPIPPVQPVFLRARPLGTPIAPGKGMTTVRYRGFDIVPRSYQLADSGAWTVDLEIRRNGRVRAFSANEHYPTREEAEAQCVGFGRRIIDRRVKGWSVESLRAGNSILAPLVRLFTSDSLGVVLVVLAVIGLGGFMIARGIH